jgi:hypothetical protein
MAGMGGARSGGSGRRHHAGSGSGSGSGSAAPAASGRLTEQRTSEVKDALGRAFALLDPTQQAAAKQILADRDIDVDAPASAPAEGSASEP